MRSVHALQQAMVRMLFDPAFVDAVLAGPVPALTEPERALLVAVDRRAWSTDTYRRSRAVHALIDEYPVTAAILGVPGVEAFLSSQAFGRCLAERGSLALDFGTWAAATIGEVALLERAIASARRAEPPVGSGLVTRPGLEPLAIGAGTFSGYTAIRRRLGAQPVQTLADGVPLVPAPEPGPLEPLLIERVANGSIAISGASEALVELLCRCKTPHDRGEVEGFARALGCDPAEAAELIDDLLQEPDPSLVLC